jgi:hypothetical protein
MDQTFDLFLDLVVDGHMAGFIDADIHN